MIVDGKARGIVTRDLVTGQNRFHAADVVVLATGGYGNVFYLSTNAKACNCDGHLARTSSRRAFRQPLLHADSPDLHSRVSGEHQSKLTLMSESLAQ